MNRGWRWSVLLLALAGGCGAGTVTPTASALVIDDADGQGNLSAHVDVGGKAIRIGNHVQRPRKTDCRH